jgi:hypothetical protein
VRRVNGDPVQQGGNGGRGPRPRDGASAPKGSADPQGSRPVAVRRCGATDGSRQVLRALGVDAPAPTSGAGPRRKRGGHRMNTAWRHAGTRRGLGTRVAGWLWSAWQVKPRSSLPRRRGRLVGHHGPQVGRETGRGACHTTRPRERRTPNVLAPSLPPVPEEDRPGQTWLPPAGNTRASCDPSPDEWSRKAILPEIALSESVVTDSALPSLYAAPRSAGATTWERATAPGRGGLGAAVRFAVPGNEA